MSRRNTQARSQRWTEWMQSARQGDESAFAALVEEARAAIWRRAMARLQDAALADDVASQVFLNAWNARDSYDAQKANAATWIYTIARNRRIDRVRQERRPELQPGDVVPDGGEEPPPDHQFEAAETAIRLRTVIGNLPPEQADVLRLAYYEDKVHAEISAERGIPLGTVKTRLRLALGRLRRAFGEEA